MILADLPPPPIVNVHEIQIINPLKEDLIILPFVPELRENIDSIKFHVWDKKQGVWTYNVVIYFVHGTHQFLDLVLQRDVFSLAPNFDWQQDYLETVAEILVETTYEEFQQFYNKQHQELLKTIKEKAHKEYNL